MSEHIIRVKCGDPLPSRYVFKQWLGQETGLLYLPEGYADVLLVEDAPATSTDADRPSGRLRDMPPAGVSPLPGEDSE